MPSDEATIPPRLHAEVVEALRVLVVAGIPVGVLVAGVGSRAAMLLLRVTSADRVRGVRSDDDFVIGRFTLGGSYNLLVLGAGVGLIGAAAYQWVSPWLLGPRWFRHVTVALGAGAVVGAMLVHSDGIDFHILGPAWLAIGLFVALPAAFGLAIGPAVERAKRRASWPHRGARWWLLPMVILACFPPTILIVIVAAGILAMWVPVRNAGGLQRLARSTATIAVVRAGWLTIAVAGLFALVADVRTIA